MKDVKNATIGYSTTVSLRVTIGAIILAVALALGYAGLKSSIDKLGDRIDRLDEKITSSMDGRWRKIDDEIFMKSFATTNSLEMPSHRRLSDFRPAQRRGLKRTEGTN